MFIEIKNRYTDEVIISGEYESMKDCLEKNRGANLDGANLKGANFEGANLNGANFRGAYLEGANFWSANLEGANFWSANLKGVNFDGANLKGANFEGANLKGANFRGAYLVGANFDGAYLVDANFEGANIWGANFEGANLNGANGILLPVIYICGSAHNLCYHGGTIGIGSERHSVEHWLENYRSILKANYYSESQIAEYAAYITLCAQLLKADKRDEKEITETYSEKPSIQAKCHL